MGHDFESLYYSKFQHPILLWIGIVAALIFNLRQFSYFRLKITKSILGRFLLIWIAIAILDAWLTANTVLGIGILKSPFSDFIPTAFVFLGDFRLFIFTYLALNGSFFENGGRNKSDRENPVGNKKLLKSAFFCSILTPLITIIFTKKLLPNYLPSKLLVNYSSRLLFLIYEMTFIIVLLVFRQIISKKWDKNVNLWRWCKSVLNFSFCYYGLWIFADLWIIDLIPNVTQDTGFLIRCLPNLLYYAGWTPWVIISYHKYKPFILKSN